MGVSYKNLSTERAKIEEQIRVSTARIVEMQEKGAAQEDIAAEKAILEEANEALIDLE